MSKREKQLEKPDLFLVVTMGNGDTCGRNLFDPEMFPITLTEKIIKIKGAK